MAELARNEISTEDVVVLAYRRGQLKAFSGMLDGRNDISEND
ncbi:hypothetical protein [Roseovarius sp. 217]|nr:hypothetical protein [Roseovarius sp. 217]EAQ23727.1 hypothetical protein ROS217_00085 [Roseovarius sp. 217]